MQLLWLMTVMVLPAVSWEAPEVKGVCDQVQDHMVTWAKWWLKEEEDDNGDNSYNNDDDDEKANLTGRPAERWVPINSSSSSTTRSRSLDIVIISVSLTFELLLVISSIAIIVIVIINQFEDVLPDEMKSILFLTCEELFSEHTL